MCAIEMCTTLRDRARLSKILERVGMSVPRRGNFSASRRDFLRQLGSWGAVLPASVLLATTRDAASVQKPSGTALANGKLQGKGEDATGFHFTDVAGEAGLGQAVNVCGGLARKRWLLEEIGCGVALFDYDNDGWLDIFLVNGTRFEENSQDHQATNFLFRNNRGGGRHVASEIMTTTDMTTSW